MFWVPHPLSAADKGWGLSVLNFDPAACLVGIEILRKECQHQNPHPLQTWQRMGHPPAPPRGYLVSGRKGTLEESSNNFGLSLSWPCRVACSSHFSGPETRL